MARRPDRARIRRQDRQARGREIADAIWLLYASATGQVEELPPADKRRRPSVYVIQVGENGPVKIGIAHDVRARRMELQVASPYPLRVIAVIPYGGRKVEKLLHEHLSDYWLRGEWFEWSPEVRRLIDKIRNLTSDVSSTGNTSHDADSAANA